MAEHRPAAGNIARISEIMVKCPDADCLRIFNLF